MLPPSLQWLATNEGVEISTTRFAANTFLPLPLHYPGRIADPNAHPITRFSTPAERELFKMQYRNSPDTSNSQNSHDGWDFGAMAIWWNRYVDALEKKKDFSSGVFRKTEAVLRAFYKERTRIANVASTIAHRSADQDNASLKELSFELQQRFRDSSGIDFQSAGERPKRSRGHTCLHCVLHCLRSAPMVSAALRGVALATAAANDADLNVDGDGDVVTLAAPAAGASVAAVAPAATATASLATSGHAEDEEDDGADDGMCFGGSKRRWRRRRYRVGGDDEDNDGDACASGSSMSSDSDGDDAEPPARASASARASVSAPACTTGLASGPTPAPAPPMPGRRAIPQATSVSSTIGPIGLSLSRPPHSNRILVPSLQAPITVTLRIPPQPPLPPQPLSQRRRGHSRKLVMKRPDKRRSSVTATVRRGVCRRCGHSKTRGTTIGGVATEPLHNAGPRVVAEVRCGFAPWTLAIAWLDSRCWVTRHRGKSGRDSRRSALRRL